MAISVGWILGPINLVLAALTLYLLFKYRTKVLLKNRIVLDFTAVSIICAFFWGVLGGTARHVGWIDEAAGVLLSQVLATLYFIFALLAVLYFIRNQGGRMSKAREGKK